MHHIHLLCKYQIYFCMSTSLLHSVLQNNSTRRRHFRAVLQELYSNRNLHSTAKTPTLRPSADSQVQNYTIDKSQKHFIRIRQLSHVSSLFFGGESKVGWSIIGMCMKFVLFCFSLRTHTPQHKMISIKTCDSNHQEEYCEIKMPTVVA